MAFRSRLDSSACCTPETYDTAAESIFRSFVYICCVTKRLIEIDDDLLHAAQAALGAGTYKETVRSALEQVVASRGRAETPTAGLLADFAQATRDLSDPAVMDAAWR